MDTIEKYAFDVGISTHHQVKLRLYNGSINAAVARTYHLPRSVIGPVGAYGLGVAVVDRSLISVMGHDWPFQGLTEAIHDFFWAHADVIVTV